MYGVVGSDLDGKRNVVLWPTGSGIIDSNITFTTKEDSTPFTIADLPYLYFGVTMGTMTTSTNMQIINLKIEVSYMLELAG